MLTQAQLIDPQARTLTVKIKRYNPELDEKPHWEEFTVEADGHDRVLDVIQKVKWYQDESLSTAEVVRARRLRVGRDADQRVERTRLQDPGQEPPVGHC